MKTSELSGAALDWAVAKCVWPDDIGNTVPFHHDGSDYAPSRKWAHGGPIIERERIDVFCRPTGSKYNPEPDWASAKYLSPAETSAFLQSGLTPLIAAMRCFVASKLGDEVDIPEELA